MNVAENVAIDSDVPVAIFSLEMSAESLVNRMLCARGPIKADNLRDGNLDDDDWYSFTLQLMRWPEQSFISMIRQESKWLKFVPNVADLIRKPAGSV